MNAKVNTTSPITTHVLDVARGSPAAGIAVRLEFFDATGTWRVVGEGFTNDDGRVADLMEPSALTRGRYRLTFATGEYFAARGTSAFYPQVVIEFTVTALDEHFHVPLLLSPFGYSTYRGS
jgi:5-hydroxyisourate hydrolase